MTTKQPNNRTPRRAAAHRICAAIAAAVLAGCAAPPPAERNTEAPTVETPPVETARAVPPPPAPKPEIVGPDPKDMIGWPADKLTETFGTANLVRRDLGSEIWQYRTQSCVLFLFLYPESGANAVRHVETRGDIDVRDCVTAVVRRQLGSAG